MNQTNKQKNAYKTTIANEQTEIIQKKQFKIPPSCGSTREEILQKKLHSILEGSPENRTEIISDGKSTQVPPTIISSVDKTDIISGNMTFQEANFDRTEIISENSTFKEANFDRTEVISDSSTFKEVKNHSQSSVSDIKNEKKFGKYEILDKLGQGGMGVVYKVRDPEIGRISALKIIRGSENTTITQRFIQEIKATARLQHPNIISVYDFGEYPEQFFTMEYIKGKSLAQLIKQKTFDSKHTAKILISICKAIEHAHKEQIIHRDLKPGNIMLDENENIKVMDFGLAKIMDSDTGLSKSGDIIGTPAYMSPEQALGKKQIDERSDVYSIGAIGYEMVTGKILFEGENVFHILHQVSDKDPIPPREMNYSIHKDLEVILLKCIEKTPASRYQSAKDLMEDLERYTQDKPILAQPPSTITKAKKWVKRNKEISISVAVLFLATILWANYTIRLLKNRNKVFRIIENVMQWDKTKIRYQPDQNIPKDPNAIYYKDVENEFKRAEELACNYRIFQQWGLFCFRYAQIHYKNKDIKTTFLEKAEKYFMKAAEKDPSDYISLYHHSLIYYSLGEDEQANSYMKKILQLNFHARDKNNAFYQLQEQIKVVTQIIKKSRLLRLIENIKLTKEDEKKNYPKLAQKAINIMCKSLLLNNKLFCANKSLGLVYSFQNKYKKALHHFNNSIRLYPDYRPAILYRGLLYYFLAHEKYKNSRRKYIICFIKSKLDLEKALEINEVTRDAAKIQELLSKIHSVLKNIPSKKLEKLIKNIDRYKVF